ncbi:hypothetical protein [Solirubrum puertoriconensis]|uniref:Uncharacterized protein n=1 Tax=Solirubrum puertoriconensis TaxID=1751427 RepID=A0A9X0L6G6_SOLP1|nr:hypothetical protein [Solirubrum puertoriconensis]KUG09726.1 hypothetical protein ASU33_18760 [Solirubrum puertoriconensis]
MKKHRRPTQLPAFLLLAALLLSASLNCYLLYPDADHRLDKEAVADTRADESEVELRLMRGQLADCQAEQLRKDSLLVSLLSEEQPTAQTRL